MQNKKTMTLEEWRQDQQLTYNALGQMLGITRQGAHTLCKHGLKGAGRLLRIRSLTSGRVNLESLVPKEERHLIEQDGLMPADLEI